MIADNVISALPVDLPKLSGLSRPGSAGTFLTALLLLVGCTAKVEVESRPTHVSTNMDGHIVFNRTLVDEHTFKLGVVYGHFAYRDASNGITFGGLQEAAWSNYVFATTNDWNGSLVKGKVAK